MKKLLFTVSLLLASVAILPTTAQSQEAMASNQAGVYNWSGRVSAGGNIQSGNTDTKTAVADANIKARDLNNRIGLGGEVNWAEDDGEKSADNQKIFGTYDRFVTADQKWFVGGEQTFERDEFALLDLRSKTGAFVGHQFYESDDRNLQVKLGPNYIYEDFSTGDKDSYAALGWALDYDQKFLESKALQFYHNHELNTPFEDAGAYIFESKTGLRVPLSKRLDASAQVDFDWDNDPITGAQEDDTTYAVKLGYGW